VSRWPITGSGSWDDPLVSNRGFAWARIDVPGTNDLYVVSVHLYNGGTATDRNTEATVVKSNVQANFPTGAWVIVAGDFNTPTRTEAAVTTFKTFVSDNPIPADLAGNQNTSAPRTKPYDYLLPSFTLTNNLVALTIGSQSFTNGLVFDSTDYVPLSDVSPVQFSDSHAPGMQHMGVLKAFQIAYAVSNYVTVPPPLLTMPSPALIRWQGLSNVTYIVQAKTNLAATNWLNIGTASSPTADISFTNQAGAEPQQFFRVTFP
jgi:hypothetical protein